MARYRILETSFVDNTIVKPGEIIDTDAEPGTHWEPLDDAGRAKLEAARRIVETPHITPLP